MHPARLTADVPPPCQHQLAGMIWVAVIPTLTALNLLIGAALADLPVVLRTFVLATVAVPIVIYGVMPRLYRIRARLLTARSRGACPGGPSQAAIGRITTQLPTCGDARSPHRAPSS